MACELNGRLGMRLLIGLGLSVLPVQAEAADPSLSAWQEITVLTVSKLEMAAANCGFSIDGRQLDLLQVSAGLTPAAIHDRRRSAVLQQQIDAVSAAYRADRDATCTKAWDTFGPDGTAHGYLDR